MVEFVYSTARQEKRRYILDKMNDALACGKKILLIAPEQQALMWDSLVASELPPSAAFKVETLSFTRLADAVFRRFGGCAKNYITEPKKALVMWRAINSVRDELKVFGRGREDRYVQVLLKAVSEARLYSQTPATLMKAADTLYEEKREEGIASRLHDLSLVWAAYDAILHESYDDPEEISDALCSVLDCHNCFEGYTVFIDSFYTLTPKERNIAARIFRDADEAVVTFALSAHDKDSLHTEHIRSYKNLLAKTARKAGQDIKIVSLSEEGTTPEIEYLKKNLWEYTARAYEGEANSVKVYTCGDRHDEAAVCAARISELVRGGARYGEIAVVAADIEALRGITDTHLAAMGIPVYISAKSDLVAQSAMRLIISACRVAAYGWKREDVISCAKTALTGLTAEQCDALEKYADKWRLRGKKAFCCEGWNMNPDGYTDRLSPWGEELLCLANDARDILIPPIEEFSYHLKGTVRDAAEAVFKLLCDFSVYSQIKEEAARLRREGRGAEAQEKEQLWGAVISVLDTLVEAAGETKTDAIRFAHLLERTASAMEIGTIPDSLDRVVLSGAGSARLDGVKHMIILGACEGEFPATPGDNGFFTQRDKDILAPLGIELSPGMDSRRSEELFRFYAAVTAPSETLSVIIPQNDSGTIKHVSSGALRIMKLLPKAEVKKDAHLDYDFLIQNEHSAKYYLPALKNTEEGAAIEIVTGENGKSDEKMSVSEEFVCAETASRIFGDKMILSQSRLECFKDCPQSYYLKYVLSLDDGEDVKISPSDVGNFVHKILEEFLGEVKAQNIDYPIDEEWTKETAERLIADYIKAVSPENAGGRLAYLFSRVTRSLMLYIASLNREFSQSRFKPYDFEMKVGTDDLPPLEIPLGDGSVMSLIGIVDRLDSYTDGDKVYIRVADYKTGAKKFSLEEVVGGRNVQLLLYLFSICGCPDCDFRRRIAPNGEELVPAGAVYFSARPGEASSGVPVNREDARSIVEKAISRTGIVLEDEDIIRAMEPLGEGKYIPASFKKDGTLSARSSVASREQMDEIRDALCHAIGETGIKMRSGECSASPDDQDGRNPCQYCKMRPVCRRDS
ncbi:MAG: PD-(D/E)XK nuclease family protein [Clostridia bacterium]|nr:PD-(D/E)XK nuclease family protein [Clostridia bacterium]